MKTSFFRLFLVGGALAVLQPAALCAANIAVMVVETNISEDLKNNHAALWENGIMDVFFGAGYIVSNARSMRVRENKREEFPPEALTDFQHAIENGSDYFVLTTLDYKNSADAKTPPNLIGASVKLFRITPYMFVYEKKLSFENQAEKILPLDEMDKAQQVAKMLLPFMGNTALGSAARGGL